jgi:hypothetical protein
MGWRPASALSFAARRDLVSVSTIIISLLADGNGGGLACRRAGAPAIRPSMPKVNQGPSAFRVEKFLPNLWFGFVLSCFITSLTVRSGLHDVYKVYYGHRDPRGGQRRFAAVGAPGDGSISGSARPATGMARWNVNRGSNGARCRLWKCALQETLVDPYGLAVTVCQYPPRRLQMEPDRAPALQRNEQAPRRPAVYRLSNHYAPDCRNANPNRVADPMRPQSHRPPHQDRSQRCADGYFGPT